MAASSARWDRTVAGSNGRAVRIHDSKRSVRLESAFVGTGKSAARGRVARKCVPPTDVSEQPRRGGSGSARIIGGDGIGGARGGSAGTGSAQLRRVWPL